MKDCYHMAQRQAYARYLNSPYKLEADSRLAERLNAELIQTLMPIINSYPSGRRQTNYYLRFRTALLEAFRKAVALRSRLELGQYPYQFHWFGAGEAFQPLWMMGLGVEGPDLIGQVVAMCLLPAISLANPDVEGENIVLSRARVVSKPPDATGGA